MFNNCHNFSLMSGSVWIYPNLLRPLVYSGHFETLNLMQFELFFLRPPPKSYDSLLVLIVPHCTYLTKIGFLKVERLNLHISFDTSLISFNSAKLEMLVKSKDFFPIRILKLSDCHQWVNTFLVITLKILKLVQSIICFFAVFPASYLPLTC